jgi:heme exporter protein A
MSAMTVPDALPPPELWARSLTVRRGERILFDDLSFVVAAGNLLLLRGPNGAGKTSLLLTLAGIIRPDAGEIGFRAPPPADFRTETHLVLLKPAVKGRLTVHENLDFWRRVNGATGLATGAALERVGLGGLGLLEAGHLSTGQLQRLALARLLVSTRRIWLLDEPTSGLDDEGAALVGEMIAAHCAGGGIAVVATHQTLPIPGDDAGFATVTLAAVGITHGVGR